MRIFVRVAAMFLLSFITSSAYAEGSNAAAVKLTRARIESVVEALSSYRKLTKRYPSGLTLLLTGTVTPIHLSALLKDEQQIRDGWNNPFVYQTNNDYRSFRLISYGADGRRGGTGEDTDIIEKSFGFNPRPDQFEY